MLSGELSPRCVIDQATWRRRSALRLMKVHVSVGTCTTSVTHVTCMSAVARTEVTAPLDGEFERREFRLTDLIEGRKE